MKAVTISILLLVSFSGYSQSGDVASFIEQSRSFIELKKLKEAEQFADSAILMAAKTGNLDSLYQSYTWRVEVDKAKKDFTKALEDFTVASLYSDSLDKLKYTAEKMVIRDSLRWEERDHVKDLTEDRDQMISLQASADKNWRSMLIVFVGLIALAGVIAFVLYRRNKNLSESLMQSKENLEQLQFFRERLFTVISSDLHHSLSSFEKLSSGLAAQLNSFSKEDATQVLAHLQTTAGELKATLNNVLHWVEYQANRSPFHPEVFDSKVLAEEAIAKFTDQIRDRKLSTHVFIPDHQMVYADKEMVEIILSNLLANAIQFTNAGGALTIFSGKKDGLVTMGIKDTGVGIQESNLSKLFDVKEDFRSIGSSNHKGAGVGLILVKDLVERNGGRIYVESTLGQGSNFYFTLPEKRID